MKATNKKKIAEARSLNEERQKQVHDRLAYAEKRLTDVLEKLKEKASPKAPLKVVK